MSTIRYNSDAPTLLRRVGYGLLIVALVHIVDILFPPQFKNPAWEIGAIALLLERIPLVLVGLALVFVGGASFRQKWEILLLKTLSWLTLAAAILSFLLIPLGVSSFLRLIVQADSQISTRYDQQLLKLNQAQFRLDSANEEDLQRLFEAFRAENSLANASTPQALKDQLIEEIKQARQDADKTLVSSQKRERLGLQQTIVKLSLISLISSYIFAYIWYATRWSRHNSQR